MSELVKAALLGLVEGITEFLPISSTGHLIVASRLLELNDSAGALVVVIQLGAVLAVLWFYRRDLGDRLRHPRQNLAFLGMMAVATAPAALLGFFLAEFIKSVLFDPTVVGWALVGGGVLLWLVDSRPRPMESPDLEISSTGFVDAPGPAGLETVGWRRAAVIGVAQVFALIPGISRSGATIIGGLTSGLDRETATSFSFYLALPILGGATIYDLSRGAATISASGQTGIYLIGVAVGFVTAYLAIGWLLKYVASHDFRVFAVYRVVIGVIVLTMASSGAL